MSDVHSETAPARTECGKQIGSHIWYELITPDPEGAKAFYDAVVGWSIGERAPVEHDYRMIGRSDGGFAGGVLTLIVVGLHQLRKKTGRPEVPYGVAIAVGGMWLLAQRFLNHFA